jgi:hypothetical protein
MQDKSFIHLCAPLVWLLCSGCSDALRWQGSPPSAAAGSSAQGGSEAGATGQVDEAARIFPNGLQVAPHASGCGVLDVTGLTLQGGLSGPELFVALRNNGTILPAAPRFRSSFSTTSSP